MHCRHMNPEELQKRREDMAAFARYDLLSTNLPMLVSLLGLNRGFKLSPEEA